MLTDLIYTNKVSLHNTDLAEYETQAADLKVIKLCNISPVCLFVKFLLLNKKVRSVVWSSMKARPLSSKLIREYGLMTRME